RDRSKRVGRSRFGNWMIVAAIVLTVTIIACGNRSSGPRYKIIFESRLNLDGSDSANPVRNIWSVNADGTGLKPLTNLVAEYADSTRPQPSPDGNQIVFVSRRRLDGSDTADLNDPLNVWWMTGDGNGLRPLTRATVAGADSVEPRWSPD